MPKRPAPPPPPKAKEPEGIDAEDVWEFWVGWMVRPYDGGWKLRRVRIPFHTLELYATDKATPANRREIVVAQIAVAERGSMFDPSAVFYMEKIANGPEAAGVIDITAPVVALSTQSRPLPLPMAWPLS